MTPAQLKVIEAACALCSRTARESDNLALWDAVEALEAEREAGPEGEIPWGQVVESDKIWSGKTRKWYEVISAVALDNDRTRVQAKGLPRSIEPLSTDLVRVQRGATGQTMDMWNVLWSAQTVPNIPKIESEEA